MSKNDCQFSQLEKNHKIQLATIKTRGHVEHLSEYCVCFFKLKVEFRKIEIYIKQGLGVVMLPHTNSDQDNQVHPEKEFVQPVSFNLT